VRVNQALLANTSLPVSSIRELIALAKEKPGEITYATAGIGSAPHLNMVLFQHLSGVKLTPVHYRGAAPAINDLMAGHVNLMSVAVNLAVQPWRTGRLKILAIGTNERLPEIPDLPTAAESGLPGYESYAWFGLFLPAGTPRDVVMKLNSETQRVFADPAFREKLLAPQMFQSMVTAPEPFSAFIKAEQAKWAKVIRDANLKIE
jgi:tripartite-type tricarboxylate transporter receptor subunit TctC